MTTSVEPAKDSSLGGKKRAGKIHPIIIFPFSFPDPQKDKGLGLENLNSLYAFIATLVNDPRFGRPLTVMNRQTFYMNTRWVFDDNLHKAFEDIKSGVIEANSTIVHTWSVDTCQLWLAGFGKAYDEDNPADDVYWLIPGDFNYAKDKQEKEKRLVEKMRQLPEAVLEHDQDIAIGEIDVDINSAKQLIDTYGTYGLLYNWFPHEAQAIRRITDKPRSEFLAISHGFLREVLRQRWYAYEQTIIILLQAVIGKKRIHPIELGDLSDLPQGREKLSAAMQQVERTERALKLFWRERNENQSDWAERFKGLDTQSGQIRSAELVILENLLIYP